MRRLFISLAMFMAMFTVCAQNDMSILYENSYKTDTDVDAMIEKVKAEIDKTPNSNALAKAMAKKMAGKIVQNTLKNMEENRITIGGPEGVSHEYRMLQNDQNRELSYVPAFGRIVINDWGAKKSIVAFPKLKLAWITELDLDACRKAGLVDPSVKMATQQVISGMNIDNINGFPAAQMFYTTEIEAGKEKDIDPENIIEMDGKKVEMFPIDGYALLKNDSEFYTSVYVDYEKSYPTYTGRAKLIEFNTNAIDETNFTLPSGYKEFKKQADFQKAVNKAIKSQSYEMKDPGSIPANVWALE